MVNIESNPLNGSSFMNDLRNKYMENQTAVEWLVEKLHLHNDVYFVTKDKRKIIEQAKEMEKDRMIEFASSFYDNCGMQYGGLEKSAEEYYSEKYK